MLHFVDHSGLELPEIRGLCPPTARIHFYCLCAPVKAGEQLGSVLSLHHDGNVPLPAESSHWLWRKRLTLNPSRLVGSAG